MSRDYVVRNGIKTGYVVGPRQLGFMTLNIGSKARLVFYLRNPAIDRGYNCFIYNLFILKTSLVWEITSIEVSTAFS